MIDHDILAALDDAWSALDAEIDDMHASAFSCAADIKSVTTSRDVIEALRDALSHPSSMSFMASQVERCKAKRERIRAIDDTVVD